MEMSFTTEIKPEAQSLLFGSDAYWQHLRAAVSEGFCPRCGGRIETVAHPEARVAGYCHACDLTSFTDGTDKEWAESGEQVGRP